MDSTLFGSSTIVGVAGYGTLNILAGGRLTSSNVTIALNPVADGSSVTVGGTLDIALINAFAPNEGDSFDILDWGSITGSFGTINLPTLTGGLGWDTSSLLVDGTLSVSVATLTGDLDGDGFVGINDLNAVLGNWNQNVTAGIWGLGDPSGDGFIGIDDLNAVLGNWNAGTPPGSTANIPEPASLAFLCLGLSGLTYRSRPAA